MIENTQLQRKNHKVVNPETYTIGIYEGNSPFNLSPSLSVSNPIISRNKITEKNANFVADPFAIFTNKRWYLFYELMEQGTRKGKLCVTTSTDRINWTIGKLVLEESFHLSYPQVIQFEGDFYMLPESYEAGEVRLYKSSNFPFAWKLEKVLLRKSCVDTTLFFKDKIWWMFACDTPHDHNQLRLYYSDNLLNNWTEHPMSPICTNDNKRSRPAGKLIEYEGHLYRVAQDCERFYGHSVNAMEITKLNKTEYAEKEIETNPILMAGSDKWNSISMHHLDLHEIDKNHWIAFVDGRTN